MPTASKDSHKPDKHFKKPTQTVKPASETSGKKVVKDADQQNGKDSTGHKQFKAEKRKRKDDKEKAMNKKKKVEEVEQKTA
ncbi:hypothetical protein M9458_042666, partial [Cirrhinus mrigala]